MAEASAETPNIPAHVPTELVVDFDRFTAPQLKRSPHRNVRALFATLPPVIWTPRNEGHWLVTDSTVAMRMLRQPDLFSSDPRHNALMQRSPRTSPNQYDPPEHTELRGIIAPFFEHSEMPDLEPKIRAKAAGLVDAVFPKGRVEFLGEIAQRYPVEIFLAMAGAPLADRDRLLAHVEGFTRAPERQDRLASLRALADDLQGYLDERLLTPREDILSAVANGRLDGRQLNEEERLGMAALVFLGGLDTVAAMLSFIMVHLATHETHYRRLITDPEIIPRAVHELVRVFGVASMERAATQTFEFDGVPFRRGDRIVFSTQTYGLDNPKLTNPIEVDFDRKASPHSVFGGGPHRCIGAHLANLEIRIFLEEWTKRVEAFSLDGPEEPETFSGVVWSPVAVPLVWSLNDIADGAR